MEYMHGQKVIHRDLKPHNVMRCQDGTLRIMDFGLAKGEALKRITLAGLAGEMGTPDYMSPEQAKGKSGDERSDIYSLGCMLYTMTTGQVPFPGKDAFIVMNSRIVGDPVAPRRINPQISPEVEEITLRAMARDPLERYSTMKELAQDVADPSKVIVTDRARRLVAPDLGQVRWRKFRPLVGAIAVVVAGLIVMLIKSSQVHH
jgi:serine/threonine-protein kinase